MSTAIHQEIVINAPVERVYAALTTADQFSALTGGAPAEIAAEDGGAFSCFGGKVAGRNIELVPNQRLVQAWRVGDWDAGVFTLVRFELSPEGAGTKVVFDQAGVPDAKKSELEGGWHAMYWEPLRKYLA